MREIAKGGERADVAVIIITYNEEANIAQCLESVCGWSRQVFLVDSFSKDRTLEIAKRFDCEVVQNAFTGHPQQLNWALDHLPLQTEWILFLDADEWAPQELRNEISAVVGRNPPENGFSIRWRFIWMGQWVRRGYYEKWLIRLMRRGVARWEQREVNQHLIVEGTTGHLQSDFVHDNHKGLADWTQKHIRYARLEAEQLFRHSKEDEDISARFWGTQAERTRWIRLRIYNRLPPLIRPALYFFYRVVIRMGFLDGWQAMLYHFLHAFWCPLLIDLFYLEMKQQKQVDHNAKEQASKTAVAR